MSTKADKPRKDGEYLSTFARGLSVLRAFTKEQPEMTLSEVAAMKIEQELRRYPVLIHSIKSESSR